VAAAPITMSEHPWLFHAGGVGGGALYIGAAVALLPVLHSTRIIDRAWLVCAGCNSFVDRSPLWFAVAAFSRVNLPSVAECSFLSSYSSLIFLNKIL
jgi:hypothetical protein